MTARRGIATTIHGAIDEVTTAVEDIHRSVADLPLDVLEGITPLKGSLDQVRGAQARSIGAVYDVIREVNERVRRLTAKLTSGYGG